MVEEGGEEEWMEVGGTKEDKFGKYGGRGGGIGFHSGSTREPNWVVEPEGVWGIR